MIRFLFLLLLLAAPATAQDRVNAIQPELVAEGPAKPDGEVDLAIVMHTQKGWHGYWQNPGDAGLPMKVEWQLPPGASVGPLRYPVPDRLTIAGLMNYVYEHDYAVLVRLKVPANASGSLPISANAQWLACTDEVCVPEHGSFSLDVPVADGPATDQARFDQWRQQLPRPLAAQARFALSGDMLSVAIPLPASVAVGKSYLFPLDNGPVDYAAPQSFRRTGDTLVAELKRKRGEPATFAGVVALGDAQGFEFKAIPGAVPTGGTEVGGFDVNAMWWAVLGALAGGLLLNLMPCVFPILALKASHLARAGGDEREARRDALAYTAGAIIGTGALGGLLLAIRAGGSAAGWAFQLQDPRTILVLLLLVTAITLNLLRVFELPVLGGSARPAGSFATGALAAFVATPCAGPFLGAALGTALLLPLQGSILVFAALGFGLALPFLVVAFVPAFRRKLPKPGPWMATLQRVLAIPMALTAAGCAWLLWRIGGYPALAVAIVSVIALTALLFVFGRLQRRGLSFGFATLGLSAVLAVLATEKLPAHSAVSARPVAGAETWSEAKVASYLAQGKPVFVYFTADWCLSCKANEAGAIDRDAVRDVFKQVGVKVVAGDWTNGDPAITRFLESRGRAGVPLYLWYEPSGHVEELPQVLTPSLLIDRARRRRP
ncbi:protein-disulfide reductase DsbD family protein [Sphingomonas alba]|uniref:Thioredoxin family protein n=1 Tax=Sphingomonas alba TaxID=2908208 RepID=A0ABT0RLY1_9SPHN|nr:protein-disulfide reductase DsbD domain-containing protein [Sphingomonas alba]MCL6683294.1 thioredoxin family protein [Sphingomonas alba]